jgi:Tfp pilus assembly protein FimT
MSLLESCVSIALISTVALFAAPSLMKARENYHLDALARQVAGKMHSTRIKAISRNRDCRMRVDSAASYVIECQDPVWRTDEIVVMPRGFRITATAAPEFHPRGNVAPTATLIVWDAHSRTKRVVVNITGRVRVD